MHPVLVNAQTLPQRPLQCDLAGLAIALDSVAGAQFHRWQSADQVLADVVGWRDFQSQLLLILLARTKILYWSAGALHHSQSGPAQLLAAFFCMPAEPPQPQIESPQVSLHPRLVR